MEKILWYGVIPLIVLASYLIALLSFNPRFRNVLKGYVKREFLRTTLIVYSRAFTFFSLMLYFLTLNEGFENKHWGELTLLNFLQNFFGTIEYFFSWIMFFWVFFIFAASAIIAIVWGVLRKLIAPKAI